MCFGYIENFIFICFSHPYFEPESEKEGYRCIMM